MSELGYLWKNFLNLQERCGAGQFWRAGVAVSILSFVALSPFVWLMFESPDPFSPAETQGWPKALFMLALTVFMLIEMFGGLVLYLMTFSLCRRRANDIELTARLLRSKMPSAYNSAVCHFYASSLLITLPVSLAISFESLAMAVAFLALMSGVGSIFLFGRFPSQPGTNPYGPNPTEAFQ